MRSVLARAGAACAAAVLLAGTAACGGAEPGVVAYVEGERITQRQLDDAVAGVEETLEPGQQVSTSAVANVLIHGVLADQIARQRSIRITDADRDAVMKESNLAGLLAVPKAKPIAYDVADQQIVAGKIGAEAYLSAVGQAKVTLNPRFGVLDPAQKIIVGEASSSLSTPAAAPSP